MDKVQGIPEGFLVDCSAQQWDPRPRPRTWHCACKSHSTVRVSVCKQWYREEEKKSVLSDLPRARESGNLAEEMRTPHPRWPRPESVCTRRSQPILASAEKLTFGMICLFFFLPAFFGSFVSFPRGNRKSCSFHFLPHTHICCYYPTCDKLSVCTHARYDVCNANCSRMQTDRQTDRQTHAPLGCQIKNVSPSHDSAIT